MRHQEAKGTAIHDHSEPVGMDLISRLLFGVSGRQLVEDVQLNQDGKYDCLYDKEATP